MQLRKPQKWRSENENWVVDDLSKLDLRICCSSAYG